MTPPIDRTPGAGPIWPQSDKTVRTNKSETVQAQTPVPMTSDSITRKDLDNISPYAAWGVNFTHPTFASRVEEEAQAMFPGFKGYYTLSDPEQASEKLADMNIALQLRTPEGVNKFLANNLNGNPQEVARHIADKNGDFAELFA